MKARLKKLCILPFGLYSVLFAMDSHFITVISADRKTIKINKKHLEKSSLIRNFFDNFPHAHEIKIPHYTFTALHVLKRSLEVSSNSHRKSAVFLQQFLKNLSLSKLHNLIETTHYFDIPSIYKMARQIWIDRCIDTKNLELLHKDYKKELMHQYAFTDDISHDMSKIMLQKVLTDLFVEHIQTTNIPDDIIINNDKAGFSSIALNNDNTLLAAACYDNTIYMVNLEKQYGFKLTNTTCTSVQCVIFHPTNNNYIAAGYQDNTIRLWNIKNRTCTDILKGHTAPILFLNFSPDGLLLASSSEDTTLRLWDTCNVKNTTCLYTFTGHTEQVWRTHFVSNNKYLLSASIDQSIKCWDLKSGNHVDEKSLSPSFGELAINQNKTLLATDTPHSKILVFDTHTNKALYNPLSGHTSAIYSLCFYTNTILCSGSKDKTIRYWYVPSSQCIKTFNHNKTVRCVLFSHDKLKMYSASEDGTIHCWQLMSAQQKQIFNTLEAYTSLPLARLIYLAWQLKKQNNYLDLSKYPHLQIIFNTFNQHAIRPELYKAIQNFLRERLSIINNQQ